MKFKIQLEVVSKEKSMMINYQYPLCAIIYKILKRVENEYASFLHNKGYGENYHSFKLFNFSDLMVKYKIENGRMILLENNITWYVSFQLPEAFKKFIQGIFLNNDIFIIDKISTVQCKVISVEGIDTEIKSNIINVKPISPIVVGVKNERGYYNFLHPEDKNYANCLSYNLIEKYKALKPNFTEIELQQIKNELQIKILLLKQPPKSKLITINENTPQETKIRGYKNVGIDIKAPTILIQLALNTGLGLYNSMGMGFLEIIKFL